MDRNCVYYMCLELSGIEKWSNVFLSVYFHWFWFSSQKKFASFTLRSGKCFFSTAWHASSSWYERLAYILTPNHKTSIKAAVVAHNLCAIFNWVKNIEMRLIYVARYHYTLIELICIMDIRVFQLMGFIFFSLFFCGYKLFI